MQSLFNAYKGKTVINASIKFGVLTNGNETIKKDAMLKELQALLVDWLKTDSGFFTPAHDDDEMYSFKGVFELIGHLTNSFCRRELCLAPSSPYLAMMFAACNEA